MFKFLHTCLKTRVRTYNIYIYIHTYMQRSRSQLQAPFISLARYTEPRPVWLQSGLLHKEQGNFVSMENTWLESDFNMSPANSKSHVPHAFTPVQRSGSCALVGSEPGSVSVDRIHSAEDAPSRSMSPRVTVKSVTPPVTISLSEIQAQTLEKYFKPVNVALPTSPAPLPRNLAAEFNPLDV
jgi:hypothetical protein